MDADDLTFSISSGTDITASQVGSDITFTPPLNFNGSENFTVTVSDGSLEDFQVITVTVNAVNDVPVATTSLSSSTAEGTSVIIQLSGSDVDGDNLTYSLDTDAANGSVVIDGTLATYTPADFFNGSDQFSFAVSYTHLTLPTTPYV